MTPHGYPEASVVWCDYDGEYVRVNTMRGFAKERNMRRNPLVTQLCYDPLQPLRSLEIQDVPVAPGRLALAKTPSLTEPDPHG